jgi:hypothetical protein
MKDTLKSLHLKMVKGNHLSITKEESALAIKILFNEIIKPRKG